MKSSLIRKSGSGTLLLLLTLVCSACVGTQSSVNPNKPNATVSKLDELLKKAKEGDPHAQSVLGSMYAKGEGVPKDDAKAVELFRKAAEQGNAEAQYNLGYMILMGLGVPRDEAKAVEYWQKAAEQGNVKAQGSLATMYEYGEIVPKDYAKAVEYWQKAAERGDAKGQFGLASMYSNGEGVPKDFTKAAEWFQKSAQQGNADAQVRLGIMYARGEGLPKDSTKAAEWYRKSAEQGNAGAQGLLGAMYAHGESVPKDDAEAVKWFRKAAAQGFAISQSSLGAMYIAGRGVGKDYVLAYAWLNLAAAQGDEAGQLNRNYLEPLLTREQRVEGQRLASNWKIGDTLDGNSPGTAIIIGKNGHEDVKGQPSEDDMKPGKIFRDCSDCPEMVVIPAGSFDMGSNDSWDFEKPIHRVTLSKSFAMGKTEVTQGQWRAIMGSNPSKFQNCGDNCPVENVSWNDAHEFIQLLNTKTGKQYRLPSEAEWEYGCQAGEHWDYCGSTFLDVVGWNSRNSGNSTHPVAEKQSNDFGLKDMTGNVWEWVEDDSHENYNGAPTDGSVWKGDNKLRVLRGGAWNGVPLTSLTTLRIFASPSKSDNIFGFRIARYLP